ncbi:hypothetical protein CYG49_04080 [Candidatus Saccharibacteria bacterium]|nr:MAG: hypothetical protein CYG49_04080 [Candidatus Saccharibacteria bacterium]
MAQKYIIFTDLLAMVVLAAMLNYFPKTSAFVEDFNIDQYSLVISMLSFGGYVGLVYALHGNKLSRLRSSAVFKSILLIMFSYNLFLLGIIMFGDSIPNGAAYTFASFIVIMIRFAWFYYRTIKLLQ